MEKYTQVQKIIQQLSDYPTLQTFYTLYLMAENDNERKTIEKRFWENVEKLSESEKREIKSEFTRSFLKLPLLAKNLSQKARSIRGSQS